MPDKDEKETKQYKPQREIARNSQRTTKVPPKSDKKTATPPKKKR